MDPVSIATFLGGLVGSALRAIGAPEQETLSRKSVVDIAIGGIIGILVPLTVGLPADWPLIGKAASVAILSYSGSNLLQDVSSQLAKRKV